MRVISKDTEEKCEYDNLDEVVVAAAIRDYDSIMARALES